jgi:D-ribose pyranase
MKKSGILNDRLSAELAKLGHGHLVTIGDCGLPRPAGVTCVDLALTFGVPSFAQVFAAVTAELAVESAYLAVESAERNPQVTRLVTEAFSEPELCTHEELKRLSRESALFIRSGEATPYANVILRCGVPF